MIRYTPRTWTRSAMAKESDPLREEHRTEMRQRTEARDRAVTQIVRRYNVERTKASPTASAPTSARSIPVILPFG